MSSPSSAAPVLHVLFVPSSCWDRLHVASCPVSLPAQSHHSDPPRVCPRSPFLHFYFYFSAKSTPSALCVCPLLSPMRLPDCVTSWRAARGARLSGGMQPLLDTLTDSVLVPRVHWDVTGIWGCREGEGGEPSIRVGLWGWLPVGPWWLLPTSPHPGASCAAGCAPWGSGCVSSGVPPGVPSACVG